jgi:hypothetical protein
VADNNSKALRSPPGNIVPSIDRQTPNLDCIIRPQHWLTFPYESNTTRAHFKAVGRNKLRVYSLICRSRSFRADVHGSSYFLDRQRRRGYRNIVVPFRHPHCRCEMSRCRSRYLSLLEPNAGQKVPPCKTTSGRIANLGRDNAIDYTTLNYIEYQLIKTDF